jgi:hypothetical protein
LIARPVTLIGKISPGDLVHSHDSIHMAGRSVAGANGRRAAARCEDEQIMRALFRSDLVRNFMGGFLLGAIALVGFAPAEQSAALKDRVATVAQAF